MKLTRSLFFLLLLSSLVACSNSRRLGDDDDDDSAVGSDDDDSVADDDDSAGDDDDATGPPPTDPEGMVDKTYCLDWNSVNITDPPGIINILNILGITVTDYPLLLSPTGVDVANEEIWMLVTGAQQGTCNQDLTISTVDLTATTPGVYTPPLFQVGPATFSTLVDGFQLTIYDMELSGQFSVDTTQIYAGELIGEFLVPPDYASTACALLACIPCQADPQASCLNFVADSAVFNDTGAGPLTVVP